MSCETQANEPIINDKETNKSKMSGSMRHKFSKEEDEKLKKIVLQHGEGNWSTIATFMTNRTARQCRERYKNYLSPRIKNEPWTHDEEKILEQKYAEFGPKWAKIALFFESRSDVNVKNHWSAMVKRRNKEHIANIENNEIYQRQENSGLISLIPIYPNMPNLLTIQHPAIFQQIPIQQIQSIGIQCTNIPPIYQQQFQNYNQQTK